jgi:hypothetical protein
MDVFMACSRLVRAEIIEEISQDWGGSACEDFSLGANLWVDLHWRDRADLSREFWGRCVAVDDSDSILGGGRN